MQWIWFGPRPETPHLPPELRSHVFSYLAVDDLLALSQLSQAGAREFAALRMAVRAIANVGAVRRKTAWKAMLTPRRRLDGERLLALAEAFDRLHATCPAIPARAMHEIGRLASALTPGAASALVRQVMADAAATSSAWARDLVEQFTCRRIGGLEDDLLLALLDGVTPMWHDPRRRADAATALALIAQCCRGASAHPDTCWGRLVRMLPPRPTPAEMPFAAGMVLHAMDWDFRPETRAVRSARSAQLLAALDVWPSLEDLQSAQIGRRSASIAADDARWLDPRLP